MHLLCVCAMRCCFAEQFGRMPKKKPQVNAVAGDVEFRLTLCFFGVFFMAELCPGRDMGRRAAPGVTQTILPRK